MMFLCVKDFTAPRLPTDRQGQKSPPAHPAGGEDKKAQSTLRKEDLRIKNHEG
jgi:hypothetical protein